MRNFRITASFAWFGLMLAGAAADAAAAAEPVSVVLAKPDATGGVEVRANSFRATLERKLRLVKQLLSLSPAVLRIPQSNNAQAKRKLAEAQARYAKAETEFNASRGEAAMLLLDESLRQIAAASSLVPDPVQQLAQKRSRNTQLREAIRTFQMQQKGLSSRMSPKKLQASTVVADVDRIDGMVDKADALILGGNQDEANVVLNSAYQSVVATLNKILAAETIVYGLKFDLPAEEFRHELARNRSYEELIPIAIAQLNTVRETAVVAEHYAQQSRDLRVIAQKQASGQDYIAAVKTIEGATSHLQRSLRIAGVVVPHSSEVPP
ncbi:MAG: hypothetical protein HHJ18_01950 [Polaromonas sp.]|nr:hypothetical protein [Polaromonas sp.]